MVQFRDGGLGLTLLEESDSELVLKSLLDVSMAGCGETASGKGVATDLSCVGMSGGGGGGAAAIVGDEGYTLHTQDTGCVCVLLFCVCVCV